MKKVALILAGGIGQRFWPKSTKELPKQFLNLVDNEKSMLQVTVERILPIVKLNDIFIATNKEYKKLVLEQIKGIPSENVICEPVKRNTAPSIGLGAIYIQDKYDDALMITLAADHYVGDNKLFLNNIEQACEIADKKNTLVTLGIRPSSPNVNYGYIYYSDKLKYKKFGFKIKKFVEKPNVELAKHYLIDGHYLWNSGMFVFKISSLLDNIKKYMSNTYNGLMIIKEKLHQKNIEKVIADVYPTFESISIDYAIFEKISDMYVVMGTFAWDDIGSWQSIERLHKKEKDKNGNIVVGDVLLFKTENSIVESEDKKVVLMGMKDVIVISTKDNLLICNKEQISNIDKIIKELKGEEQ